MDATRIHRVGRDWHRIQRHKENLIDYDTLVDDRRAELLRALDAFTAAVSARDAEARALATLIKATAA